MQTIPKDKIYHFVAGFILCVIGCIALSPIEGIGLAIIAGALKECYDQYDYDGADWKDMIATWIGGCVGFTYFMLVDYWFK